MEGHSVREKDPIRERGRQTGAGCSQPGPQLAVVSFSGPSLSDGTRPGRVWAQVVPAGERSDPPPSRAERSQPGERFSLHSPDLSAPLNPRTHLRIYEWITVLKTNMKTLCSLFTGQIRAISHRHRPTVQLRFSFRLRPASGGAHLGQSHISSLGSLFLFLKNQ